MEYFMVPLLVLISIFSIMGTIYQLKTKNKPGLLIGGLLTLGIVGVTLLSLVELFIGIE